MEFRKANLADVEACTLIARNQYFKEREFVESLYKKDYSLDISKSLNRLFDCGNGIIAHENEEILGYLAFGNINTRDNGVAKINSISSPVFGYGIKMNTDRGKLASQLFQQASMHLSDLGVEEYSIKLYAHDSDVIEAYVFNNFGILCTDGMCRTKTENTWTEEDIVSIDHNNSKIDLKVVFKELTKSDMEKNEDVLICLWQGLVRHLRSSPTYYPGDEFKDEVFLTHIYDEGTRVFVAMAGDQIIGMVDVSKDCNSFITRDLETINIADLYIIHEFRGQNIADRLFSYVKYIMRIEGIERIWVEHGTTNPAGRYFWGKHFSRYTYTLTRSIDRRIFKYNKLENI